MNNSNNETFEDAVLTVTKKVYGELSFRVDDIYAENRMGFSAVHAAAGLIEIARSILLHETEEGFVVNEAAFREAVHLGTDYILGDDS